MNKHRQMASTLIPCLLTMTLLAGTALAAPPGVRHVRADAAPGGDGLSWETAYNDLRAALADACSATGSVTELWVAEGVYTPSPSSSPNAMSSFRLVPSVGVYGGFAGTETSREQRDPASRVTMLSGQISPTGYAMNVVVGAGNTDTILDGFTITGGRAWQPVVAGTGWAGGGIHITGSPTIRNCIISSNTSGGSLGDLARHKGGGVYCAPGSAPTLIDCIISGNSTGTSYRAPGFDGGGLATDDASVHLIRCTITNNQAGGSGYDICGGGSPSSTGESGDGGGLYALNSSLLLEGCTLDANSTGNGGEGAVCGQGPWPGLDAGHGAGIYSDTSVILAVNCTITRNRTGNGGRGGSRFVGTAGGDGGIGGGLFTIGGDVDLVNCTIANNVVGSGGLGGAGSPAGAPGAAGYGSSIKGDTSARLENCISWNDGLNEIVGAVAAYSDVRGGYFGPGVITADPRFINAAGGDYRLMDTSPCIDAGNSFPAAGALPATDADGLTRRVDITAVADTGVGAPVVDMGAYEVQSCAIDYTGDGIVDFSDYLEFLNLFDAQDPRADLNHDGIVDFSDYLEFLNLFDAGC